MTQTVFGVLTDALGHASDGRRHWATPALEVRTVQDTRIAINLDHNPYHEVGEAIYFERDRSQRLWLVAEVADDVAPSVSVRVGSETRSVPVPFYWSAERVGGPDFGIVISAVALTASPARVAARPVEIRQGDAHMAAWHSTDSFERGLLQRASEARLKRHGGPILVVDQDASLRLQQPNTAALPPTRIETRSAELDHVAVDRRELTAIVAPYESPTVVEFKGRRVYEMFQSGCFDNVPKQAGPIRLNRDHRPERVVGKAIAWDTSSPDGLIATFRLPRTRDGDEVLELAAADCLDCSVGFGATRESWPQADMRLINEGFVDHVAVTSSPAYRDARVIGVRGDQLAAR